jgi:hypothetical protein
MPLFFVHICYSQQLQRIEFWEIQHDSPNILRRSQTLGFRKAVKVRLLVGKSIRLEACLFEG